MTSNVWHSFCTYWTKEHRCLLHFSIIMSHSVLSCTCNNVGNKTKSIRPRPKLQDQDQDQGRSETGLVIRDPKTATQCKYVIDLISVYCRVSPWTLLSNLFSVSVCCQCILLCRNSRVFQNPTPAIAEHLHEEHSCHANFIPIWFETP